MRGFTLVETIVTIAVLGIIILIGVNPFATARERKAFEITADTIVFTLEEAKANAISGKDGQFYGVKFNDRSFISFTGSSYISTNQSNKRIDIEPGFTITNTIAGTDDAIVFERLTGDVGATATVTVSNIKTPALTRSIVIGTLGDITVIE